MLVPNPAASPGVWATTGSSAPASECAGGRAAPGRSRRVGLKMRARSRAGRSGEMDRARWTAGPGRGGTVAGRFARVASAKRPRGLVRRGLRLGGGPRGRDIERGLGSVGGEVDGRVHGAGAEECGGVERRRPG